MPDVPTDTLTDLARRVLTRAGALADEAATVARLTVAADLAGHPSHGVAMIPGYVRQLADGEIRPGAPFEVIRDSPTTTVVDGHGGFGFVVTERAMSITIDKARAVGMAATTVRGQSHVGRLAAYPLQAARQGLIAVAMASGRGGKWVVPFGGRDPRLGTNPVSVAVPSALDGMFAFDMATSAVAGGLVRDAQRANEPIPEGWIVDADGRATTDPHELDRGGALVPFGGPQAHKGYALSATVEALANVLAGIGFGRADAPHGNGCFLACFDVATFCDPDAFAEEMAGFAASLTSSRPALDGGQVLYPGEQAARHEARQRRDGIAVDPATLADLEHLAG